MLYTKPINEIAWNDIDTFCQQKIAEGAYLDYKQQFPGQLEKTISAMANTFGGIILIGVEEDNENKPVTPVRGIDLERGLSERVTNIILANITPPVFPEIQVCSDQARTRAFVLVRIPQSNQAPHAITRNTKVYIRTGDVNNPEELATVEQITWLSNHRATAIALRDRLYTQAETRYQAFYQRALHAVQSQQNQIHETTTGILSLSLCPTYPNKPYRDPSELASIHPRIWVPDYYGTARTFPPPNALSHSTEPTIVQDGVILVNVTTHAERVLYAEINSFGLYFYRQPLKRDNDAARDGGREVICGSELVARLDEFIDSAGKFYRELGFWGFLDLRVVLASVHEIGLAVDWLANGKPVGYNPDYEVSIVKTLLTGNLDGDKEAILVEVIQRMLWAFGLTWAPVYMDAFDKRIRKGILR